jgi:hypothetical protein
MIAFENTQIWKKKKDTQPKKGGEEMLHRFFPKPHLNFLYFFIFFAQCQI